MSVRYNPNRVREDYERRHPDRKVVGLFKSRKAAFKALDQGAARMVDLSYGYYVVTSPAA